MKLNRLSRLDNHLQYNQMASEEEKLFALICTKAEQLFYQHDKSTSPPLLETLEIKDSVALDKIISQKSDLELLLQRLREVNYNHELWLSNYSQFESELNSIYLLIEKLEKMKK